jgi:serine protease AprX
MAGIIAGDGAASGGRYAGVAPGARILSLKVAGADGSSDVSKVVAAIQWAVSYRERYGIRVLNLSLGTDSVQSWEVDPFNYAVERAWEAGITVVVSASNRGPAAGTVSKPGDDPYVITVGAIDDRGTEPRADDRLPDFSSRGPTAAGVAKPDVAAPGVSLVSLRAPGSTIDQQFPEYVDGAYHRGSGTSMATAAVSGGVALLLQQHPGWTPGQVKQALRSTAVGTVSSDPSAVGSGLIDLVAASQAVPTAFPTPARHSSGLGSLDASRGHVRVDGATVQEAGTSTLLGAGILLWDPVGFATGEWSSRTWPVSPWATHRWHATTWAGDNWHGDNWHGDNWHGDWTGSTAGGSTYDDSYGEPWMGGAWYGLWD